MSLVEMLKLGKEIKKVWPRPDQVQPRSDLLVKMHSVVEFLIEKDPHGRGGFWNAFKARTQAQEGRSTENDNQQKIITRYLGVKMSDDKSLYVIN